MMDVTLFITSSRTEKTGEWISKCSSSLEECMSGRKDEDGEALHSRAAAAWLLDSRLMSVAVQSGACSDGIVALRCLFIITA